MDSSALMTQNCGWNVPVQAMSQLAKETGSFAEVLAYLY